MMKCRMLFGAALICTTIAAVNLAQPGEAQSDSGFAGEYHGVSDGGMIDATITKLNPTRYKVEMSMSSTQGCGGGVEGAATASGNMLTLLAPNSEDSQVCKITFTKTGNRLAVREQSCAYFHGLSCAFVGTMTRKGANAAQRSTSQGRTRTAEPLFGAMEDGGPAGGALVTPQGRPKVSSFSDEWYAADDFVAIDDSSDLGLSLTALCYGSPLKPMMGIDPTILIRGFRAPDPEAFSTRERLRLFAKTPVLTLTAFNAKGSKTAVMTFGRTMQEGKPSFFRPLSATELSLIKASSRLLVSSAQWAAVFTGRGAARQLSGVRC